MASEVQYGTTALFIAVAGLGEFAREGQSTIFQGIRNGKLMRVSNASTRVEHGDTSAFG